MTTNDIKYYDSIGLKSSIEGLAVTVLACISVNAYI